jgi:hypothetical protein
LSVLAAVTLAAAGCTDDGVSDGNATTTTTATTATTTTVPPQAGALVANCGAAEIPVGASPVLPDQPLDAEALEALDSMRVAVGAEGGIIDAYDWAVADRTEETLILFGTSVNPVPPGAPPYADILFRMEGGEWVPAGWGQCNIIVAAPDFGNASWVLDLEPDPGSTELFVQANERDCASGQPPVGREVLPVVIAGDDRVTITVLVEPVQGGANCPSNPWFPLVIDLGEPLGDRTLFDGSRIPPLIRPWPPTLSSIDSLGSEE